MVAVRAVREAIDEVHVVKLLQQLGGGEGAPLQLQPRHAVGLLQRILSVRRYGWNLFIVRCRWNREIRRRRRGRGGGRTGGLCSYHSSFCSCWKLIKDNPRVRWRRHGLSSRWWRTRPLLPTSPHSVAPHLLRNSLFTVKRNAAGASHTLQHLRGRSAEESHKPKDGHQHHGSDAEKTKQRELPLVAPGTCASDGTGGQRQPHSLPP
ncbi:hypothetical protein ABL78_8407 [Leptomonas seymouri]|uniref:Uncharacterized protein n=1 Tax=Leptomonas seymouri TaxID=5684 RepID=A0A0N1P8Z2_LEPSE|nr:hypothetical protein ABL78_8407 [Leptomonas seymouri]|eukprot:KPI82583.1 hypothetical protein ABL78_8407 [Leptomonas seymouri]